MKKFLIFSTVLIAGTALFSACKRPGCTDPLAINYFSKAKTDDGLCSYSTTRMVGLYNYVYDTIDTVATVFSLDISVMKVQGRFDEGINDLYFDVNWDNKSMVMPDTLLPDFMKCTGTITDKDNFKVDLIYDPAGTIDDTSYTYTFARQ